WSEAWEELAKSADAVCFGTLAQRSEGSRTTIQKFQQTMRPEAARIFDVNLRQTFFSAEILWESLRQAEIMKVNYAELPKVAELLEQKFDSEKGTACWLAREFGVKLVCVTRGHKGSLLFCGEEQHEHPGFKVKVADTVGSGDAFTAALVYHWLRRTPLEKMNVAANRMGAWVASEDGAMPAADESVLAAVR